MVKEIMWKYITIAMTQVSTTYGYGELQCSGECSHGNLTASGESFIPNEASVAIPLPSNVRIRSFILYFMSTDNECVPIIVNDKKSMNTSKRGFDFSPGALRVLGYEVSSTWSSNVGVCLHSTTTDSRRVFGSKAVV